MSDDIKNVNQNPPSMVPENQTQPQAAVQPSVPVGSVNKEVGPNLSEFVRPAGPEISPNLSQEERESGVEVKSDKPSLTFEHKELGLDHAGPDVTVSTQPSGSIKFPMSEEEVKAQLEKKGQDGDSKTGLAKLIAKVIKVLGL